MVLSNAERQRRHRAKAKAATALITSLEEGVALVEETILVEQDRYGTRPNDGSAVGKLMADQMDWVRRQRADLEALKSESGAFYEP
jgi:hypothetical protein